MCTSIMLCNELDPAKTWQDAVVSTSDPGKLKMQSQRSQLEDSLNYSIEKA